MPVLGTSKDSILKKISENPVHGYMLAEKLDVSVTGIYQHLKELRQEGYIYIIQEKNNKKIYDLTEKGKSLVKIIKMS